MTPILRNRHEKVQEASINLIGRIGEFLVRSVTLHPAYRIPQRIEALSLSLRENGCEYALSCSTC